MRHTLLFTLMLLLSVLTGGAFARQLAFPGAEGYGRYVTGGRGGEVCYVTRLDDCTDQNLVPGTLRWALRHNNGGRPRTILFATAGTIYLQSKLSFNYGDVSILGQTAPGGGITITGYNMYISKNNVIIRHLRFRAGDIPDKSMTGLDLENARRVIIDHCSMTWSMEECLTAYDTDSTTIQWCIIGEGLYNSKNAKGERAYATQWGGEHSSMLHTLITNSMSRSPRFNGVRNLSDNKGDHDFRVDSEFANNVVFNWGKSGAQYGGEYDKSKVEVYNWQKNNPGYNRVFLLGNYYRPGPATQQGAKSSRYWCAPSTPYGQWYLEGNKFEVGGKFRPSGNVWSDAELQKVNADNLYGAQAGNASRGINLTGSNFTNQVLTQMPYALSGYVVESADDAFVHVTSQAGASLPRLDEVDARLLAEARGDADPLYHGATAPTYVGIIDSPDDIRLAEPDTYTVNGKTYHNLPLMFRTGTDRYFRDSDADGMPDGYEETHGLDKADPADGAALAADGYTNLEHYLNAVADGTIRPDAYCTSLTFIEPGPEAEPQASITYTFTLGSTGAEGAVPAAVTLDYGQALTIPANTTLYLAGHTLTGWTDGNVTLAPGQSLRDQRRDVLLIPVFTPNKVSLTDRTESVTVTWDVSALPLTSATGIAVTQVSYAGSQQDVALRYAQGQVTVPSCTGATLTVDGTATPITGSTHTFAVTSASRISVTLPYVWNSPSRTYHAPELAQGQDFELFYTTRQTVEPSSWIQASYLDYAQWRTFYDPAVDDDETCTDGSTAHPYLYCVVFNGSTRTFHFYVQQCRQLRLFLCHQSSNPDRAIVRIESADGTDVRTLQTVSAFIKQQPVNIDVPLDASLQYRIVLTSEDDYDWAIGAIKLWPAGQGQPEPGSGLLAFSASAQPSAAATIISSPSGNEFQPGSVINLEAKANPGYYFQHWADHEGHVLSTQPVFAYTLQADATLTAVYKTQADFDYIFEQCAPYDAAVHDVQELLIALQAAASRPDREQRYRIFLHDGTYDLGTKAKTAIPGMTSLIGQSQDGVLILNNPGTISGSYQDRTPTLFIDQNQNDVYLQDLTIRQARDWTDRKSQGQAIALRQRGKRAVYKNVTLQGVQDTYYLNKADGTAYFQTCTLAGEVDFIYGDGTMWFEECLLQPLSAKAHITASNAQAGYAGIVFHRCTIQGASGYSLGRPWSDSPAVTYLHTAMLTQPTAAGWGAMTGGLTVRFHEYGSTDAQGQPLDLTSRSIKACQAAAGSDAPVLTQAEAEAYTVEGVLSGWDPAERARQIEAPTLTVSGDTFQWSASEGAIGYALLRNGQVVAITTATSFVIPYSEPTHQWTLRAINAMGGMGQPSAPISGVTGLTAVTADAATPAALYNLQGQPIAPTATGFRVGQHGKAMIR